jgi:phosphoserine phosphatase
MSIVIPCSGEKSKAPGEKPEGATILQSLPEALADELAQARHNVAARIFIDESTLMPAWRRSNGLLYQNAREAIRDLTNAGAHVVILSAGYGAISATEHAYPFRSGLRRLVTRFCREDFA